MHEIYPGKGFIDQIAIFIHQLELIEDDYWWWFKCRHGKMPNQDSDMMINHVEIDFLDHHNLIFKFSDDSELPQAIRQKCLKAYFRVFRA